jgi:hypothetical protein
MRPSRNLPRLAKQVCYRLDALNDAFNRSRSASTPDDVRKKVVGTITIDALNVWANFSRAYYLSCCLGARSPSNGRITTRIRFTGIEDAIVHATLRCNPRSRPVLGRVVNRRDEPKWHVLSSLLNSCDQVGVSNYTLITASVSIPSRVFQDLLVFRNYFAHKNRGTEAAAIRLAPFLAVSGNLSPYEILVQRPVGRSAPQLKIWIGELDAVVQALCS